MAATAPSQSNTYVPEATDKLVVSFSRNVDDFPLNRYVQIVPVKKQVGLYLEMTREEAGRVGNTNLAHNSWPDGAPRPQHNNELESFEFKPYATIRRDWGFNIGELAVDQATWDVVAENAGIKAEQAMRARTQLVVTAATTAGNYAAAHTAAVSSGITGNTGYWDMSTTARNDIHRSLDYAADIIMTNTLNGVKPKDLIVVISKGLARKLAITQEITDYIKGSPDAYAQVRGELPNRNIYFGLPAKLYGYELVIEDTVKTTSKKGATTLAKSSIMGDTVALMTSRVGGLVSERTSQAPSFSSLTLFMKEEMSIQQENDAWNRLIRHSLTEDYCVVNTAPSAAFLFTAVTA